MKSYNFQHDVMNIISDDEANRVWFGFGPHTADAKTIQILQLLSTY